ncbi:unnamed protein product [Colias eurytheme]|nr:unnamed protein product [Colias eurytheme]
MLFSELIFEKTQSGNGVMIMGKYRFNCVDNNGLFFEISQRKKPVLIVDGYRFNKVKELNGPVVKWNCAGRYTTQCKMKVKTKGQSLFCRIVEILEKNGRQILLFGGNCYSLHYSNNGRSRWRCKRCIRGCGASLITIDKKIVKIGGLHNH